MQVDIDEKTWAALLVVVLTGEPPSPQRAFDAPENERYYAAAGVLGEFGCAGTPELVSCRSNYQ